MLSQAYHWAFQLLMILSYWKTFPSFAFPIPPCSAVMAAGSETQTFELFSDHPFCLVQNTSGEEAAVGSENNDSFWKRTPSSCSRNCRREHFSLPNQPPVHGWGEQALDRSAALKLMGDLFLRQKSLKVCLHCLSIFLAP